MIATCSVRMLESGSPLHPNGRGSWRAKDSARKVYLTACQVAAMPKRPTTPFGACALFVRPLVPDLRVRDLDNVLASAKYAFDALRYAGWYEDDRVIRSLYVRPSVVIRGLPEPEIELTVADGGDMLTLLAETSREFVIACEEWTKREQRNRRQRKKETACVKA